MGESYPEPCSRYKLGSRPKTRDTRANGAPFLGIDAPFLGYPQTNFLKKLAKIAQNTET